MVEESAREAYAEKLREMSDDKFRRECEQYIWLSAYAANNYRSDYHWMCDMTYAEALRRDPGTEDGHGAKIYREAHDAVTRQEGHE